jgi:uncharacterized protein
MDSPNLDPSRLDVAAFAKRGGSLQGEHSLQVFGRLLDQMHPDMASHTPVPVVWSAAGEVVSPRAGGAEIWLSLKVDARIGLVCQRCLEPVSADLAVDRRFRFVEGEQQAAELDAESDDDVLTLSRRFNLMELIEDELVLTLPLVPRHSDCVLRHAGTADLTGMETAANPFEALSGWKLRAADDGA